MVYGVHTSHVTTHALMDLRPQQAHIYTSNATQLPHIARGGGLHAANTGVPSSFTIELVHDDGQEKWTPSGGKFIYVWIASEDQVTREMRTQHNGSRFKIQALTFWYNISFQT